MAAWAPAGGTLIPRDDDSGRRLGHVPGLEVAPARHEELAVSRRSVPNHELLILLAFAVKLRSHREPYDRVVLLSFSISVAIVFGSSFRSSAGQNLGSVDEPNKSGRNTAHTTHSSTYLILYYVLEAIYISC